MPKAIVPGPVQCNAEGEPHCGRRKDLVDMMGREAIHPDKFSPVTKWSVHKKEGRVQRMFDRYKADWSLPENSFNWFNKTMNHRWSDHKTKNLKPYFTCAKGDFLQATSNRPVGVIDEANWLALCEHFRTITTPDLTSGKTKSDTCAASRKRNKYDHALGRTSLALWTNQYNAKFNKNPNAGHLFDKGYLRIDAIKSGEGSSTASNVLPGITMHPELRVVSEKLHNGVQERIIGGSEMVVANVETMIEVLGRSKLGVSQPKIRKMRNTRNIAHIVNLEHELKSSQSNVTSLNKHVESLEARLLALEAKVLDDGNSIASSFLDEGSHVSVTK